MLTTNTNYESGCVSETTRVFIGGLSELVTALDIERTFCSFGNVKSVDIVRTNGRSFAYMDFEYDSPKSLNRLMSTYNGCIWRGGRLRLEKAKEHYTVRLQREWLEDEESKKVSSVNIKPDLEESKNSRRSIRLREENMQLNLYFPTLKKVKLLPYSGTGKHKYSFQRVIPPTLPIHFCDCDEHCPTNEHAESHVNLNTVKNGIDKNEIDIMNSVMDNIFKREAVICSGLMEHNSSQRNDATQPTFASLGDTEGAVEVPENEGSSDSDILVTNIAFSRAKESNVVEREKQLLFTSKTSTDLAWHKSQKTHDASTQVTKLASTKKQMFAAYGGKEDQSIKKQMSEAHTTEVGPYEEADTSSPNKIVSTSEIPPVHAGSSSSWVKTSFRDLLSGKSNSMFKLSDMFQMTSKDKEEILSLTEGKKLEQNIFQSQKTGDMSEQKSGDHSKAVFGELISATTPSEMAKLNVPTPTFKEAETPMSNASVEEVHSGETVSTDPLVGDVCTFMRSTQSEKEWAKVRAAVTSIRRKHH